MAIVDGGKEPSDPAKTGEKVFTPNDDPEREPESGQTIFKGPISGKDEYTDDRKPWEWESKYPPEARRGMKFEAYILGAMLVMVLVFESFCLGFSGQVIRTQPPWPFGRAAELAASAGQSYFTIDFRILAIFFAGWVGGTTFAIKWLVHAVATGRWHLDRRYWRLLIPCLGGVYACVVLTLFDGGVVGTHQATEPRPAATAAALAFLVGYFSDGVSGLLSNVANAVFGTLEKK